MAKKNVEDRLAEIKKQEKILKAEKKELIKQIQEEEEAERIKRQTLIGAAVEGVYGKEIPEYKIESLIIFLREQNQRGGFFSKALDKADAVSPEE